MNLPLETFLCVADAGSFNKAAEELFISPPAVIKQINALELELDLTLFIRTHRGLILTESGESFYKDVKHIMRYLKGAVDRAKEVSKRDTYTIRIGASLMTPANFLVDLWPKIQHYLPDIKFKLVQFQNTPETVRQKDFWQDIDIVVGVIDPGYLVEHECGAEFLSEEPFRVSVSTQHRLAEKESLSVEDLYGERLMLIHRNWNGCIDKLRDDIEANYPQIEVVTFDHYAVDAFNRCCEENCVILTIDPWKDIHPLMKVLPVDWEHRSPFGMLHAPEPSEMVSSFLDAVNLAIRSEGQ